MSRAFVKDDDGDREEKLPARAAGDQPNYVTPQGLEKLHAALRDARAAADKRNEEYYEGRIASAILVEKKSGPKGKVAFGATVVVREGDGAELRLHIVGEDEADPAHGSISWTSPYAQALLEQRAGKRVTVQRPKGAVTVTIVAVDPD